MKEPSYKAKAVYASDSVPVTALRGHPKPRQPMKKGQLWLLFRRTLIVIAAIVYINNVFQGALTAFRLLEGIMEDAADDLKPYQANYINTFAQPDDIQEGDVPTVGKGKLVNQILNGILTPRTNQTLYLHSTTDASFNECTNWTTEATQRMYNDVYLRKLFSEVVRDTAIVVPEFVGTEMVVPIVDCSFTALREGDKSNMRAFYLMRKTNSDKLSDSFIIAFSLSMQDYRYPDLFQTGPTGLLVMSIVSDFTDDKVLHYYVLTPGSPFRAAIYYVYKRTGVTKDGYVILESVPTPATADVPTKVYMAASRVGIYRGTETEQAHLKNMHWDPSPLPALALSTWQWRAALVRHDAWSWVYCTIYFAFGIDSSFNLLVLLVVIYRNKLKGKIWIGDAFVSISKSATTRALFVLLAWVIDGFWIARKFMLEEGNVLGDLPLLDIYPQVIHADLMILYLGIVDIVGFVMCERIDPALSMLLYEIGFANRIGLAKLFPSLVDTIIAFAQRDYALSTAYVHPKLMAISPLRLNTIHELSGITPSVGFATLFPFMSTLIFLFAYLPIRKVYRHYYPDRIVKGSNISGPSIEGEENVTWKSSLTIFEVATGAALQSRVGLVSDYDNCIYIKGMKFASADGVYCNGFVVANHKYLVRTNDLWYLFPMILTRIRFRDIYVYDVDGYTVQKMARLFYPEMMTFSDLLTLHSMILS